MLLLGKSFGDSVVAVSTQVDHLITTHGTVSVDEDNLAAQGACWQCGNNLSNGPSP